MLFCKYTFSLTPTLRNLGVGEYSLTEVKNRCPPPTCECDLYNIGEACGEEEGFLEEQKRLEFARRKYVSLMSHKGKRALGNQ